MKKKNFKINLQKLKIEEQKEDGRNFIKTGLINEYKYKKKKVENEY